MVNGKVVIAGPKGVGKSCLASALSEISSNPLEAPGIPTAGVRILEIERRIGHETMYVEVWDASGDPKYESMQPAIMENANGVILVFNPNHADELDTLRDLYRKLVVENGLNSSQCLILAHKPNGRKSGTVNLPRELIHLHALETELDSGDQTELHDTFDRFLADILSAES